MHKIIDTDHLAILKMKKEKHSSILLDVYVCKYP